MRFTPLLCLLFFALNTLAQQQAKVGCIGFYNLENLFDTEDDPLINDSEYTPTGSKLWTEELYQKKAHSHVHYYFANRQRSNA